MKIMKRILYYIVLLFAMLSCTEQVEQKMVAEGKLATTVSVVLPQIPDAYPQLATRAMAMNPQMENLYLAVFDDNGYLLEYVKATDDSEMATENKKEYTYNVSLTPTDFPTYVHFIGNAPSTLSFGTEVEAVGRLFTEGGAEAYWQKITFPQGIKTNANGTLDTSVVNSLKDVRLVRNFAWIKLTDSSPNFEIQSYCVINTRTQGTVAPYNTTQSQFADFAHQQTYTDLVNEGYEGFIPAEAELNQAIPAETTWFTVDGKTEDNYAYFIYEREKPTSNPTFILVKGTYTPDGGKPIANRFYKVDLRQGNGDYFPIIRNFRYNIEISNVKHEGHATAAAAVAGAGSGDVSTAIETEDFTNISNNIARIFVNYTDTVLVNQMTDLKLRYKFMVFETEDENGNTTDEQILNGDANVSIELGSFAGGKVIQSWTKASADEDGWREITISTTELENIRKSEEIILKGKITIGEGEQAHTYQLQRKVTVTLCPKYDMQLVCDPTAIQENLGEPFDLLLKVPGGLGSSMFPLEFQIEAEKQSITPNLGDDLPVVTGKSIIASKNQKTTIGFIKHIEWSDYDALPNEGGYKTVRCHFKSNKAKSATDIYAQNKYFNQVFTTLSNYVPSKFTNLTLTPDNPWLAADSEVEFSFAMEKMPSQGYVTLALNNMTKAEDEDRLNYIGVDANGRACYSFNPESIQETSSEPLLLKVDNADQPIAVYLSAYQFEDNSTSLTKANPGSFNSLNLKADNPMLGEGTGVDFTFNMSVKPVGSVVVTLTNLQPAANETRLIPTATQGKYRFTPKSTTISDADPLKLEVLESNKNVSVTLEADNFTPNSAELSPQKGQFEKLTFSRGNITNIGTNVNFTFNMTYLPSEVIVALTNLKPAAGETRLEKIRTEGNVVYYRFYPTTTTINNSNALKLEGTASGIAKVELSADNFDSASKTIQITYSISSGKIKLGNKPSGYSSTGSRTFYIYSSDSSTDNIGYFSQSWNNKNTTNSNSISLTISADDYEKIINNNNLIYIKFTYYGRTYTTTANLKTLLNGTQVELDW